MAKIIARRSVGADKVNLSVRVYKRNVVNTLIPLGVSIGMEEWLVMSGLLDRAEERARGGDEVAFRDSLAGLLWEVKTGVEVCLSAGVTDLDSLRRYVVSVMHRAEREAMARREAEAVAVASKVSLKAFIRRFIAECESGERLRQRSTHMISASTIKSYKGTLSQLEEFERVNRRELGWDDMTLDFYDDWKRFFVKKRYSPNTIGRHVKNLKIWLRAARDLKLTTTTDFESKRFAADHEEVDNVYLTEERIQAMYDFNPTDVEVVGRLIAAAPLHDRGVLSAATEKVQARWNLEVAKDVFVVGCLTGQRVSDYKRIHEGMITRLRDGREYIYLQQEKTGKWIYIPIDPRVRAILRKYGGRLPKVYDQDLNERIKMVGRLLGWREDAGLNEFRGVMVVPSGKKFYECVKTHTARRSFATNAYKNGIALSSIMAITGHSSELLLRKYLKMDNKERAILAAQDFDRLRQAEGWEK